MQSTIAIGVQIGIGASAQNLTLNLNATDKISHLRFVIAQNRNTDPALVNLIWNSSKIQPDDNDLSIGDIGMTDGSNIICILSSGRKYADQSKQEKDEAKLGTEKQEDADAEHEIVLSCEFDRRPFGFAVWANAQGKNAIVTKVAGKNALTLDIKIGYVVYRCNGKKVYGRPHDEVLQELKTTKCPLTLEFADLGEEYECDFKEKPLGFTVIQDREENNAKVSKINTRGAQDKGIKIGSYIVKVNDEDCFGSKHKEIINTINRSQFPMSLVLRHPPSLLMLAPRRKKK